MTRKARWSAFWYGARDEWYCSLRWPYVMAAIGWGSLAFRDPTPWAWLWWTVSAICWVSWFFAPARRHVFIMPWATTKDYPGRKP